MDRRGKREHDWAKHQDEGDKRAEKRCDLASKTLQNYVA